MARKSRKSLANRLFRYYEVWENNRYVVEGNTEEIAKHYGVTAETIRERIREYKIFPKTSPYKFYDIILPAKTLKKLKTEDRLRMVIGNNAKLLREQKGWSQKDIAEKLGTNQANVSNFEVGKAISIPKLAQLIDLYQVDPICLFEDMLFDDDLDTIFEEGVK